MARKRSVFAQESAREKESVFTFELEQRRRLRIPLDCRIRYELRMNVHCSAGVAAYGDTLEYENCEQTNHI